MVKADLRYGVHFTTMAGKTNAQLRKEIQNKLESMARPAGEFDAQRYFRGDHQLRFYNIGTTQMRAFARAVYTANRGEWSAEDAMALADDLIRDPYRNEVGRYRDPG